MHSFNRVILIGNLTRDPEIRSFQSGTQVANFSLAVNEKRKGRDGELIEEVAFIDVTCWGRMSEIIDSYAKKGSSLLVEGRLKQESWEKDGRTHTKLKVVADRVLLCDGRRDDGGANEKPSYQNNTRSNGGYRQQQQQQQSYGNNSYRPQNNYRQQDARRRDDDGFPEVPYGDVDDPEPIPF